MADTLQNDAVSEKYDMHSGTVFRLCYALLGNKSDAEDAMQETFLRYIRKPRAFESTAHERAWFIRVTVNLCRDRLRFRKRHSMVLLQDTEPYAGESGGAGVLESILALPARCKAPLYMHYVEGYSIREIAQILRCGESAVKARMLRGRRKLRLEMDGGETQYARGKSRPRV